MRSLGPVPPRRLAPSVPRDLETVCLKCLHKEPARRYATAQELADDLRRFLDGEPIRARPVGRGERLWKWARRNPTLAALVGLAGLAVAALVLGILGHNARLRVEAQRADAQGRRADANYREARDTLNRILTRFEDKGLADVPRLKELRRDVLENALAFYQGVLQATGRAGPAVPFDTAVAHQQAGYLQAALGRQKQGEENVRRAVNLFEQLAAEDPADVEVTAHLAGCLDHLGISGIERAGPGLDTVKEALTPADRATMEEAEGYLRRALRLREALHQADRGQRRWREALAATHHHLAVICWAARKRERAEHHCETALSLRSALAAEGPANPAYAAALAQPLSRLAHARAERLPAGKVEPLYARAEKLLEPLVRDATQEPEYAQLLADLYVRRGHLLRERAGQPERSLDPYGRAIRLMAALVEREPRDARARLMLHNAHGGRAYAHQVLKRYAESVRDWDRVVELSEGADRAFNRSCRANTLALSGAHARAAAEAAALVENPEGPDDVLFNAGSGGRAFGTLNAGRVTDAAPAATLRTDVIAAERLASTPDANTNDPFVQEKAAELDYDPQRIFDYLNEDVGYESYVGSLRGARGTLWSAAGNSLDEASLGSPSPTRP